MGVFLSTVTNKIDGKGRVSVPASFRRSLVSSSFSGLVAWPNPCINKLRPDFKVIECFSYERISQLSMRLDDGTEFVGDDFGREYGFYMMSASRQLSFDDAGRIMLPQAFCRHAEIEDEVTFSGLGEKFYIWSPTHYSNWHSWVLSQASQGDKIPDLRPLSPLSRERSSKASGSKDA